MKTKKILALALAAVLLVAVGVGGTLAWLKAETETITNTFTPSTLSVTIDENKPTNKTAEMVPGATIEKDPFVSYTTDVAAYLFVKVTKSANYDAYLNDYVVDTNWKLLDSQMKVNDIYATEAVFYRPVDADSNTSLDILNPESVTVKTTVTKAMMDDMIAGKVAQPTLSFQAYIIQSENLTVTEMSDIYDLAKAAD